jgi:hypothetical protein
MEEHTLMHGVPILLEQLELGYAIVDSLLACKLWAGQAMGKLTPCTAQDRRFRSRGFDAEAA